MWVFISYASEDRGLAEEIHLALAGAGHQTFFDRQSLPAGGDFHGQIKAAVERCDRFIFLISPDSIRPGGYALTELKYASGKWRHPLGHVLPVVVRPVDWESIPKYLKAVTVLEPVGNIAAEALAALSELPSAIDQEVSAKPARTKITAWIAILALALAGATGAFFACPGKPHPGGAAETTESPLAKSPDELQKSLTPEAPELVDVRQANALEGLSCPVSSSDQTPIASEYTVDRQRGLLLAENGAPVMALPVISRGSMKKLRFIVVHSQAGYQNYFQRPKLDNGAGVHVMIARDGDVRQFVPFSDAAVHAMSFNPYSVGIELENYGNLRREDGAWVGQGSRKIPEAEVVRDPSNDTIGYQKYTIAQLKAFFAVACALRKAYPSIEDVVGHNQIRPLRKSDPGPHFPMREIRRRLFVGRPSKSNP